MQTKGKIQQIMQSQVSNKSENKTKEKQLQSSPLTELKVERKNLANFTKFGNVELAQNVVSLSLFKRVNKLYLSVLDAKKVLLNYKKELTTVENVEDNCITPLAESNQLPMVFYKREDLTSIKAYKVRGALYQMKKIIDEHQGEELSFITASTGNHALGVLKAAEILNVHQVTIFISEDVTEFKKDKLKKRMSELSSKGINAKLMVKGKIFEQTNAMAKELTKISDNCFYIDPYNTLGARAGQGTIGLELLSQLEGVKEKHPGLKEVTVIVPIGGGGLISGISCALKNGIQDFAKLKDVSLEVFGVKLQDLTSIYGDAIKVKTVGEKNDDYIKMLVEKQISMSDNDMKKGMDFVYNDIGVNVEGASAGTLKPILENKITPSETHAIVCVLSGGNIC